MVESSSSSSSTRVMDVKVLLLLLAAAMWRCEARCHNQAHLTRVAKSRLRRYWSILPATETAFEENSPKSCPVMQFKTDGGIHKRSLSPWRYVRKTLKDHHPETFSVAECLCSGCIVYDEKMEMNETQMYNSRPVVQIMTFLKLVRCEGEGEGEDGYRLEKVLEEVPVGCTCVVPQY